MQTTQQNKQTKQESKLKLFFETIKKAFLEFNTPRLLIIKSVIFISILTIVLTIVFVVRDSLEDTYLINVSNGSNQMIVENGFINIVLTINTGIGFGVLKDNTAAVYALQSLVMLFMFAWILFADRYEFFVSLSLVVSGAFSNIVDRATSVVGAHAVLDYFQFWFGGAIFNFADVCVVVGFIVLVLAFIVHWILEWKEELNEAKKEKAKRLAKITDDNILDTQKNKDVSSDAFA